MLAKVTKLPMIAPQRLSCVHAAVTAVKAMPVGILLTRCQPV